MAWASIHEGKVVGVSDGDTVTVLISGRQTKVRLAEIDAPEKRQPFGERSKQSLSDLVYGKRVKVNQQDLDRYGRVVGRVYTDNLDVNAEQVKRGMAWIYRQYNRDRSLLALEQEARGAKRGLWSDLDPIPPWEYRHGGKAGWARRSMPKQVQAKAIGSGQCGGKRYCSEMGSCSDLSSQARSAGLFVSGARRGASGQGRRRRAHRAAAVSRAAGRLEPYRRPKAKRAPGMGWGHALLHGQECVDDPLLAHDVLRVELEAVDRLRRTGAR